MQATHADYFLWRKYEMAIPAVIWRGGIQDVTYLWPTPDAKQCNTLTRWDRLAPAFAGFASRGAKPAYATAYWASSVMEVLSQDIVFRSWILGADAADLVEYFQAHLMDVWMGEHTPYLVTRTDKLCDEIRNMLPRLLA